MMNKNNYSAIREENVQEEVTGGSYYQEEPNPSSSIWSSCFPCFQSRDQQIESNSLLHNPSSSSSWMIEKLKDLKEYSEVVAGPKWKNFVRKIGKYCSNPNKPPSKLQFQYDSHSYALNFDDDDDDNNDDGLSRNFSTRFAAPFPAASVPPSNNNNNNASL